MIERTRMSHVVVEGDCWFSCPASGECCRDGSGSECECGAGRVNAYIEWLEAELEEAQLRSIEARNPGIDLDEVRRLRGVAECVMPAEA